MKLGKILAVELTLLVLVVAIIVVFVEFTPYLVSADTGSSIGMYDQREFGKGSVVLQSGQTASTFFNYSTYDPAILVIDLTFESWQTPGVLSIYCNGRLISSVLAEPSSPDVSLTMISVSGWEWVKPQSRDWYTFGNEIKFVSESENGFAGSFSYVIGVRGSR